MFVIKKTAEIMTTRFQMLTQVIETDRQRHRDTLQSVKECELCLLKLTQIVRNLIKTAACQQM